MMACSTDTCVSSSLNGNMSFTKYRESIEEGDTIIIYLNVSNLYTIKITKDDVFQTKYGALKHNDLIGHPYGTSVKTSKGWVYVLYPTPELWTLTLPHRTQILYSTDISLIVFQLDLKPGKIVCEAGTGSGSLSHAIIRAIAPNGHLHTFDFHEHRTEVAREEFKSHGFSECVTVRHRDVAGNGFGIEVKVDAVFLDLPHPWLVIPFAATVLKKHGARIASFSPCIEQVQKTTKALTENEFINIMTLECIHRPFEVKNLYLPEVKLSLNNSEMENTNEMDSSNNNAKKNCKNLNNPHKRRDSEDGSCIAFPSLQTPGHTGYLTFASYNGSMLISK